MEIEVVDACVKELEIKLLVDGKKVYLSYSSENGLGVRSREAYISYIDGEEDEEADSDIEITEEFKQAVLDAVAELDDISYVDFAEMILEA